MTKQHTIRNLFTAAAAAMLLSAGTAVAETDYQQEEECSIRNQEVIVENGSAEYDNESCDQIQDEYASQDKQPA